MGGGRGAKWNILNHSAGKCGGRGREQLPREAQGGEVASGDQDKVPEAFRPSEHGICEPILPGLGCRGGGPRGGQEE